MRKINCILIEDEEPALEIFKGFISKFDFLDLRAHFIDAISAQNYLLRHSIDVIFLDIQLPGLSGMEFLEQLQNRPLVIITSAYSEHAVKAFDEKVFDYLLKPYSFQRFSKSAQRIHVHFNQKEGQDTTDELQTITLKSGIYKYQLSIDSIIFIESQNEYILVNSAEKDLIRTRMTMKEIMGLLDPDKFIQIHRSFIVNKSRIKSLGSKEVKLENHVLPLSRTFKNQIHEFWSNQSRNSQNFD